VEVGRRFQLAETGGRNANNCEVIREISRRRSALRLGKGKEFIHSLSRKKQRAPIIPMSWRKNPKTLGIVKETKEIVLKEGAVGGIPN